MKEKFKNIIKHKYIEEILQTSESKYRTLLENLPQKIFFKDKNSVYVSCNKNYARDLKIRAEEIIGKTDYDFFPKALAKKYRRDDKKIIKSGKTENIEEEYVQNRHKTFVNTVKTPVKDEQGNIIGVLGIFWDITKRKKMEEELRQSKEEWRSLAKTAPTVILTANRDGKIEFLNRSVGEYTPERTIGTSVYDYVLPDQHNIMKKAIERVFQTGKPQSYEIFGVGPKGPATAWYETRVGPVRDKGRVVAVTLVCIDITERKNNEDQIIRLKEYNENILENIPNSIIICDRKLKMKTVNKACCKLFNCSRSDIIGKHLSKILGSELIKSEKLDKKIVTVLKKKKPLKELEIKYNFFNNIENKVLSLKIAGVIQVETKERVLLLINDITEKKELEKEIRQADKLASVGQMAAGLAHEINNPMAIIKGNAQYLQEKVHKLFLSKKALKKNDIMKCLEPLERIVLEAERCGKITSGLLQFTRKDEYKFSFIDINDEIITTLRIAEHNLSLNKIKVIQKLSPNLPKVLGNKSQLRQVFMNMILNAQDAMPKGGMLTVRSSYDKRNKNIIMEFIDAGCGISKKDFNKIFDPFFTTKKPGRGIGLGLSVSHGIIIAHKGTIEVKSEPQKGTIFTIKLPTSGKKYAHARKKELKD